MAQRRYALINKSTSATVSTLNDVGNVTITSATTGDLIRWNGSAWVNYADSNYGTLSNVVEDTTPQLGGSLDVNGNKIVSTSNADIDIEPNGTGNVLLGNMTFDADQSIGAGQDNYVLTYDNATGEISLEAAGGGVSQLTDLSDVSTAAVTNRFALMANGSAYVGRAIVEADVSDLGAYITDVTGDNLSALADVTITSIGTGELLKWNGSAWINNTLAEAGIQASGSYLSNVSEDTTPQLGGNLDVNGNKITSASSGNIDIEPNGTGNVLIGNYTFDADQTVGAGQDNYVLTYDNAGGLITLEAASGGSSALNDLTDVTITGANAGDIVAYNGSAWVDLTVGANDTVLTADSGESTGLKWDRRQETKVKTADESVTTSTTLQDDDHFTGFNLETGAYYSVEGCVILTADPAGDAKINGAFTNTPQLTSWSFNGRQTGGGAGGDASADMVGTKVFLPVSNTNKYMYNVSGFILANATTGGTFKVQWAQNASHATATTIYKGSWLRLTKIQ